jgi:aspartate-semialdehyde dehydrogenase
MTAYRIAIVGAATLLGRELAVGLRERNFPALPPLLLDVRSPGAGATAERGLLEFGDEPMATEACTPAVLADRDLLLLAGGGAEARQALAMAAPPTLVVDLAGALPPEDEGVLLAGLETAPGEEPGRVRILRVAHPAAQALAHLLDRLALASPPAACAATVFEPASQQGWPGMRELEQQTTRLLSLQSIPDEVFGAQLAFNLRAGRDAEALRQRITAETAALRTLASAKAPALEVLQAPLFHATLLSLYVKHVPEPGAAALAAALRSPWLTPCPTPDALAAAASDTIQLAPPRPDPAGGYWITAALDNLRRTVHAGLDAALAVLEARRR